MRRSNKRRNATRFEFELGDFFTAFCHKWGVYSRLSRYMRGGIRKGQSGRQQSSGKHVEDAAGQHVHIRRDVDRVRE